MQVVPPTVVHLNINFIKFKLQMQVKLDLGNQPTWDRLFTQLGTNRIIQKTFRVEYFISFGNNMRCNSNT